MPLCQACGKENPEGFRFCGSCGAPLVGVAREVRKTVTVVFCDVSGSTALGERLDPEAMRRTMGRHFEEIRLIVKRHGGTVEKFIGDAAMAVFGIPVAHEDDALRAVRAVAEIRERLAALGEELSVALSFRTGVNTGGVVSGEGETLVTGDAVNVAARLEQAAAPGEILIGADTLALVRDAVAVEPVDPLELKGKSNTVAAFRLLSVDMSAQPLARHLDAPLVGRVREQGRLQADFESVVSERACHLFTLLGPAGVGKSRLVAEFLARSGDAADVLRSRCLHYGEDITYWPLVEILLATGTEPEAIIGSSPAETQLAFRKLLEARAAERPQILVLDDIQWAEPVFLDLIEHVADWARDAPIFLLCVARPELLELRPFWGGGKLNATTILLEALSGEDCELLISRLAGGAQLSDVVRRRILQAADGNPLFIEEMLATVSEDGDDAEIVVPPTIQALLQSRLDRLGAGERDMIGRGAVEGQVFHRGTVLELAPETERADVSTHLLALIRKEMIRPDQPTFPDEEAFRFRHLLIRDAAYDSLPKEMRAELHERFADWLDLHAVLVEQDEIVGYHLERAYRNRAELDSADPRLDALARRAAIRLSAAGQGALARGDFSATCGLLERAATLLPAGDSQRLETVVQLSWPLIQAGRIDDARTAAAELADSPQPRFAAFGLLLSEIAAGYAGAFASDRVRSAIASAENVFTDCEDNLGLAWIAALEGMDHWFALRSVAAAEAVARMDHFVRASGDGSLVVWGRKLKLGPISAGPTNADVGIVEVRAMLAEAKGILDRAELETVLGKLLALDGEIDAARDHSRRASDTRREAGQLVEAAAEAMTAAFIEKHAGDLEAAERVLRGGVAELERLGAHSYMGTTALDLAEILAAQGRYGEASQLCLSLRERVNEDDLVDVIGLDGLEGFLAARHGDHDEGERLTAVAVERAAGIDFYEQKAQAYEWRARTLAIVGRQEEASAAAATALAIYEAKGDRPAAVVARELLESLSA